MKVFITVDTEFWPSNPQCISKKHLQADIQRDIYGEYLDSEFGLNFQLEALTSEGLQAIFFVESLNAVKIGVEPLAKILGLINKHHQDLGLHIHPEWLHWIDKKKYPNSIQRMGQLSLSEQITLVKQCIELLNQAGNQSPILSFRAGNYAANSDTLRALNQNGIKYDLSYNINYLHSGCDFNKDELYLQPRYCEGVIEIPVSYFQDYPGHFRPTQLNCASYKEMKLALLQAEKRGWKTFVIVMHSFELVKYCPERKRIKPDYIVIDRYTQLLQFLGANKDRFIVEGLSKVIEQELITPCMTFEPLRGKFTNTLLRWKEQAQRRIIHV